MNSIENDESNLVYNILTANGFRPIIMQPPRVTQSSATLIDNICINAMVTKSDCGNLSQAYQTISHSFLVLIFSQTSIVMLYQNLVDYTKNFPTFLFRRIE